MPQQNLSEPNESRTRVIFDLRDILTEDEIQRFEQSAQEAGAASITEHFLNIAIPPAQP
jgi:hypothetical protein